MIAALYVQPGGVYYGLPDVEPWGLPERDARDYAGPHPVVAHPPCNRWAMPLAKVNETRYGHKVGDDGGCFDHALRCVREFGGVLEHPANTAAWRAFDLLKPSARLQAWTRSSDGGWVASVYQSAYGHRAHKPTWLYAHGVDPLPLVTIAGEQTALVGHLSRTTQILPRLSSRDASRTPIPFRDLLLSIARTARRAAA